jgi:hypothetical protein
MDIQDAAVAEDKAQVRRIVVVKDGKKMELVSQEFIDSLKSRPPPSPLRPVDHKLLDSLRVVAGIRERYRTSAVSLYRAMKAARDCEKDVLDQYEATGYAYLPLDEEDEEE